MCDFVIDQASRGYRDAVHREACFWAARHADSPTLRHPSGHPRITRYVNELISGRSEIGWMDYVIEEHKPTGALCSLGAGEGSCEAYLADKCDFERIDLIDLSSDRLERASVRMGHLPMPIRLFPTDLNFLTLQECSYDWILCRFTLHHIVNLEHLLCQIARSLRPGGRFVLFDYVGESRYRWPTSKRQFINGLAHELRSKGLDVGELGRHQGDTITAPDDPSCFDILLNTSPFETICSGDIEHLIPLYFPDTVIRHVTYGAALHSAMRILNFDDWDSSSLAYALDIFINIDRTLTAAHLFKPCGLFGIYGKPLTPRHIAVHPWTLEHIQAELEPRAASAPSSSS